MAMTLFSCRAPTNLTPRPSSVTAKTAVSSLMSPNTVRTPRAWMSSARIWNTGAIRLSFISASPLRLHRELVPDVASPSAVERRDGLDLDERVGDREVRDLHQRAG